MWWQVGFGGKIGHARRAASVVGVGGADLGRGEWLRGVGRVGREVVGLDKARRGAALVLGLFLTASGVACTTSQGASPTQGDGAPAKGEAFAKEACFNIRDVDSFSPLGYRFVYVRLLGGKQFLLTMADINTGLPSAIGVTIAGTFDRVCSDTGATLTFTEFGRRVSSRILRVEEVDSKDTAQALAADRAPH